MGDSRPSQDNVRVIIGCGRQLNDNGLCRIHEDAFSGQRRMTAVHLENNRLRQLGQPLFRRVKTTLTQLQVSGQWSTLETGGTITAPSLGPSVAARAAAAHCTGNPAADAHPKPCPGRDGPFNFVVMQTLEVYTSTYPSGKQNIWFI